MTLRTRLLLAAGALVATIVLSGLLIIRVVESSELRQIDGQLRDTVPSAIRIGGQPRFDPAPAPRAPGLSDRYLGLVTNGRLVALVSPQAAHGRVPALPRASSTRGAVHPTTVRSAHGSGRWRAALLPAPDGNQLLIAVYMGSVDATAAQLKAAVLIAGGVVALVLLAAGFWIERLGLRPIARMKSVADAVVAGDRNRRVVPAVTVGETAELARALNELLDQQHAVEQRLRQFVADASHELRTPTSVISGLAQLWRQGELREGEALEDAMRRIGRESARMKALVEELLLLARLDEGMPIRAERVDMSTVLAEVLDAATSTHPSRAVRSEVDGGIAVRGEPAAVHRVVSNLVTNALVHTPSTSAVAARLSREGEHAVFEIVDSGPGMTAADAAHAFDRFWRADSSRTRSGSGLGLPIVQAIVTAHGGSIEFDSSPERGTTVRVRLPMAESPAVAAEPVEATP